ncbi:hypothetical protein JCM11491_004199 [Sporobolomyces phaffii]
MWNSLSGSLSNYLHSTAADASTRPSPNPTDAPSTPPTAAFERVQGPADGLEQDAPHTPAQTSQRLSPNSLSASGNQTMAGVLAAHPQFSVFRKSTSREGLDELLLNASRDHSLRTSRKEQGTGGADDENRVETLATPPAASPRNKRQASPSGDSSGTSSFHFSSLEGADLPSLNFGDHSSSGSLVGISPRASPSLSDAPASPPHIHGSTSSDIVVLSSASSSVRLIPDSPPTTRRPHSLSSSSSSFQPSSSTTVSRATRTPSRSSSSSSLSRSQSVTRVGQFSPLSLCPSPLIGAPTLPPPPPPPALSLDDTKTPEEEREVRGMRRTSSILKLPRTPGTGRSVRFTESIIDHGSMDDSCDGRSTNGCAEEDEDGDDEEAFEREESPSILPGSRQQRTTSADVRIDKIQIEEEQDQTESALDFSAMTSKESISTARAGRGGGGGQSSFLDKLKQVIPSPDVSLVEAEAQEESRPDLEEVTIERTKPATDDVEFTKESVPSSPSVNNDSSIRGTPPNPHSAPPSAEPVEVVDEDPSLSTLTIGLQPSLSQSHMLFDESNPCPWNNESVSVLGPSSMFKGVGGPIGGLSTTMAVVTEEAEDNYDDDDDHFAQVTAILPKTPRAALQQESFDVSKTPRSARPEPLCGGNEAAEFDHDHEDESPLQQSGISHPPERAQKELESSDANDTLGRPATTEIDVVRAADENSAVAVWTAPTSDSSQSFYRRFMASRAAQGGSRTAAEEWNKLESGEKASPKEQHGRHGLEQDEIEEASVYYSPEQGGDAEEGDQEDRFQVEKVLVQGGSFYELEPIPGQDEHFDAGMSVADFGGTFLSPIAELSEPESTANSPLLLEEVVASLRRSRTSRPAPLPSQPDFASTTSVLVAAPATPSKIPRPRQPLTVSHTPFVLRLDPELLPHVPDAYVEQTRMVQQLVSTQQDQLECTASQRTLLSALVTNLQNEVGHKTRMVENLKRQVVAARHEVEEVERIALLEARTRLREAQHDDTDRERRRERERERGKVTALEETVRLLADELDTRLKEGAVGRRKLEREVERTRAELVRTSNELRETEVRLRHAERGQSRAEDEARTHREKGERATEAARESGSVVNRLKAAWQSEVEERDRAVERLRQEVLHLKEDPTRRQELDTDHAARIEEEVRRRVDDAKREFERQSLSVKHELVVRDEALAQLRLELARSEEEANRSRGTGHINAQQAELAEAEFQTRLAEKDEQLQQLRDAKSELEDELDEAVVKLEDATIDRDRLVRLLNAKEVELAEQQDQSATAISAMKDLELAVARFERDAASSDTQLAALNTELELRVTELKKRDARLTESDRLVAALAKDKGVLQAERDKAVSLAENLKRDSADREIRITKLKKRIAELDEDVFGLNIALDAKQQEASHWKRQLSQLKVDLERTTNHSTVPPSANTARSRDPSTTVQRSKSTSANVLLGLHNDQSTPSAGGLKRAGLSRRSSRPQLAPNSSSALNSAVEADHDLTLQNHDETPSRLPPPISKSTSVRGDGLRMIHFPNVPERDPTPRGRVRDGMAELGVAAAERGHAARRESANLASKENEPPVPPGSRRSSSSRRSSMRGSREALLA